MKTFAITLVALALAAPAGAATINIPKLHLKATIAHNIDQGPAFWPVTGRPGGGDTVAIAGHRTTHTRPFTYINTLKRGDKVFVRYQGKWYGYVVTSRKIVSANNLHIADAVGHERLLLTACSLPDGTPTSARWRIVVYALPV
jgi:sortase A